MTNRPAPVGGKKELRAFFKELCRHKAASGGPSEEAQNKIVQHLAQFLEKHSGTWGGYRALPFEADIHGLEKEAARIANKSLPSLRWVYPRMHGSALEFVAPSLWAREERFGIEQPVEGEVVPLNQIQGLLIPGLAFDRQGNRLGRGKGYYDQTLSSFDGIRVGVAFSWQIAENEIPHETHDIKMNFLVSETGIHKC